MNILPQFLRKRVAHRPNLLRIVDNIGWLSLDKGLRLVVGLFVGVWVARYLGPEQYGLISYASVLVGLVGVFGALGLKDIVVRDIVTDQDSARELLGTAWVLMLIGGVIAYALAFMIIGYLRPGDSVARSIVALLGLLLVLKTSDIATFWFESQVQSKYTIWAQHGALLLVAAAKILLILKHAPVIAFAWAIVAEATLAAFFLLAMMNKFGSSPLQLRVSLKRAKYLIKNSWPLMLSGFAILIYMRVDQIMLGQLIGNEAVGVYAAALRISEFWYFAPTAIVVSVLPTIIQTRQISVEHYYLHLQKLFGLMVFISLLVALPLTFLSTPIVFYVFGEAYADAGPVLAVHVWAAVFVFLGVASSKWFLVEDQLLMSFYRTALGAVVNIGLNLWLIQSYAEVGAALATLASQASAAWLFDLFHPATRKLFFMKLRALNPLTLFGLLTWKGHV